MKALVGEQSNKSQKDPRIRSKAPFGPASAQVKIVHSGGGDYSPAGRASRVQIGMRSRLFYLHNSSILGWLLTSSEEYIRIYDSQDLF